jgi:hypothetical protein
VDPQRFTNPNTAAALERVMQEMQNLVDHPRIQQRTWVATAKTWLPLLRIIHGELTGRASAEAPSPEQPPRPDDTGSILVEVSAGRGQTFVHVELASVQQIEVSPVRGNGFILKDGRRYLTSYTEAQRLVDAMRRRG